MDPDVANVVLDQCFPPGEAGPIVILRGYFDESGTHHDSPWVTMSGWIAEPAQWIALSGDWSRVLKAYGVTEAHGKEMHRHSGDFTRARGWDDKKLLTFRLELCHLVQKYVRFGVTLSVIHEDYKRVVVSAAERPEYKGQAVESLIDPYNWLMAAVIAMLVKPGHGHLDRSDRLACVFDEGHSFPWPDGRQAEFVSKQWFYWLNDTEPLVTRRIVRHWNTAPSVEFPPLQAADLLAWGSNRASREDIALNLPAITIRGLYNFDTPVLSGYVDKDGIEGLSMGWKGAPWPPGIKSWDR